MNLDLYQMLSLIISILSLIVAILGFMFVINKLPKNKRVFYGDELVNEQLKIYKLNSKKPDIEEKEYKGGKGKIFPQLIIEVLDHRRMKLDSKYRKCKEIVTQYFEKENENNKRMYRIWYIK